jgi:protocatechuate 3,4-dioxygenase, alpha subunit
MSLQQTTSQTVGPYFAIGLTWLNRKDLTGPNVSGEKITIEGRIWMRIRSQYRTL